MFPKRGEFLYWLRGCHFIKTDCTLRSILKSLPSHICDYQNVSPVFIQQRVCIQLDLLILRAVTCMELGYLSQYSV
jgi:hypothetical protein